jgi:hypothetical protein
MEGGTVFGDRKFDVKEEERLREEERRMEHL